MKVEEYIRVVEGIAEKRGWKPNPDREIVSELVEGLLKNKERYGKTYCPCRVVSGIEDLDKKIICPCVYAEEDVREYGRCFCGLYVSVDVFEGRKEIPKVIPDRHAEFLLKRLAEK